MLDEKSKKSGKQTTKKRRPSEATITTTETINTELSPAVGQLDGLATDSSPTGATSLPENQQQQQQQQVTSLKKTSPRISEKQRRQKRRRSLFAVLFAQNRSGSIDQQHQDHKSSDDSLQSSFECGHHDQLYANRQDDHNDDENPHRNRKPHHSAPHNRHYQNSGRQTERDIVLIKPTEARCVEATVASLVNDNDETATRESERVGESPTKKPITTMTTTGGQPHKSSTAASFFGRGIGRRFRKKKSRDEDADSYVMDLNNCLDREKLRMSSSSTSCSASLSSFSSFSSLSSREGDDDYLVTNNAPSRGAGRQRSQAAATGLLLPRRNSSSKSKEKSFAKQKSIEDKINEKATAKSIKDVDEKCSPLRETSPIDNLWQTNREYIPARETNNNINNNHDPKGPLRHPKKQASPTLVEFLQSHQIHMDLVDSLPPSTRPGLGGGYSSSSSRESLPCSNCNGRTGSKLGAPLAMPPFSHGLFARPTANYDPLEAAAANTQPNPVKLSELSESDRRLYHWRKLAARSVSMWQVPDDSSSDDDDSNSAEFLDCHRPAMVCYCSDDTSCSSVELVWSPRAPASKPAAGSVLESNQLRELERQRQLLLTRPLQLLTPPSRSVTPLSSDLNLSSSNVSISPESGGGRNCLLSSSNVVPRMSSRSPPASPNRQSPQIHRQPAQARQNMITNNNSNNSSFRSISNSDKSAIIQKPSILELAKPSRARDRRIGMGSGHGDHHERYQRIRRPKVNADKSVTAAADLAVLPDTAIVKPTSHRDHRRKSVDLSTSRPTKTTAGEPIAGSGAAATSREWSAVPVSRPASASDWHPNPLFGRIRAGASPAPETRMRLLANDEPAAIGLDKDGSWSSPVQKSPHSASPQPPSLKEQQAKSCDEPSLSRMPRRDGKSSKHPPLARHSSVADNLHQQRDLATTADSEKQQQTGSKSNRFMSFLARIKSRHDSNPTTTATQLGNELIDLENESIRENLDTISMNGFSSNSGRARRHRWSLRMRSPFAANSNNNTNHLGFLPATSRTQTTSSSSDNAYLSQMSANLDKIKSQLSERLSDTGKRASVLADQLITSIKDTTKEQLLIATTGTTARDRYDTLPNSFGDPLLVEKQLKQQDATGNTADRKAKLFSLIYMHQQQQVDGRPVITRQPTSSTSRSGAVGQALQQATTGRHNSSRPQSISICQQDSGGGGAVDGQLATNAASTQIDLDKLLDPKELLMDKFRALRVRENARRRCQEEESEFAKARLSRTIASRAADCVALHKAQRVKSGQSFKPKDSPILQEVNKNDEVLLAATPKRRSSCTV